MSNPLPPSLDLFKDHFEADRIEWNQTKPGWGVAVEAQDLKTNELGSFGFQIVDIAKLNNGFTDAWVELDENSYNFTVDATSGRRLLLPKGTLMRAGISYDHFPRTNASMAYLGGISVGRDFSFEEVQTPDGTMIDSVIIPKISAVHSFLPIKTDYVAPETYTRYREAVARAHVAENVDLETWAKKLDEQIANLLLEYFPESPEDVDAIQTILSTFHPHGRYTLAAIMACAQTEGSLHKYRAALETALKEEFSFTPPIVARGLDFYPATQRGFDMMIRGLGLEKYAK